MIQYYAYEDYKDGLIREDNEMMNVSSDTPNFTPLNQSKNSGFITNHGQNASTLVEDKDEGMVTDFLNYSHVPSSENFLHSQNTMISNPIREINLNYIKT